jgi:hypothetical protein
LDHRWTKKDGRPKIRYGEKISTGTETPKTFARRKALSAPARNKKMDFEWLGATNISLVLFVLFVIGGELAVTGEPRVATRYLVGSMLWIARENGIVRPIKNGSTKPYSTSRTPVPSHENSCISDAHIQRALAKMTTIYFDLDGTLTDPKLGITRSIQYALSKLDRPPPPEDELMWCIGPPLRASLKKLLGTDDLAGICNEFVFALFDRRRGFLLLPFV